MSADTEATKLPRTLTAFMALMDEDGDIPLGVIDAILKENARLRTEIESARRAAVVDGDSMSDISTCRLCKRSPAEGWAVADNGAGWTTYGERPSVETETGEEPKA